MSWHVVLIGLVGAGLLADAPKGDGAQELAKLKGSWTVTSYEREARKLPEEQAKAIKVSFTDDKFNLLAGIGFTGGKEAAVKIDPAKKPKTIDLTPADGRNKGKTFEGIYQLEGDTLKCCFAAPGTERPKDFSTKAGSRTVLLSFQRDKN